ncbi:PBS lyase [Nocardiopsis sp. ATB16-24]|uniref:PBS lyase n=1 Tax=Nocardiopsis sp. ATB16-24 TaxID=3019555 RepID=UPI0025572255|nr:PBS lyase [Nocardiopsis sp. ATB16-24]
MTIQHTPTENTGITAYVPPNPARYNDPAEYIDFARPIAENYLPFDSRSNGELEEAAFGEKTALERERALWELADRASAQALPTIARFLAQESDSHARQGSLWLALKTAGKEAVHLLRGHRDDEDPEVADWARVLLTDATGRSEARVYTSARVEETGGFDQTVPLVISGSVIVDLPETGPVRAVLSPQWFESLLGRVLASTNVETIRTDLTIEKRIEGFNEDGSPHLEIYPFRGTSVPYGDRYLEHTYLSETLRPYFPSGIVGQGEAVDVPIALSRVAMTGFARRGEVDIQGSGVRADRLRAAEMPFVQSVRGRYFGWAAVNLEATMEAGRVEAGHVQLGNPTDPIAGERTNARLYGTFRGKSGDYTGEGRQMTLNTEKCHGSPDGRIDVLSEEEAQA